MFRKFMMIKFTWLGTAASILEVNGTRILFDPFFYRNEKARPILKTKREDIKDINAIFISHGHFDHATDAAWFAENLNTPVYCDAKGKQSMINWAEGKIIKKEAHPLSERGKNNINIVNFGDTIKINEQVEVDIIRSRHIRFDKETIDGGLNSAGKASAREMRMLMKVGAGFPLTKVFGFCVNYKGKRIVDYGSLFHKYTDEMKKYENCEVLIIPIAGNSPDNLAIKGGRVVDVLKPKIIIMTHWDAFFFPLPETDTKPFEERVKETHPNIKILKAEIDKEIIVWNKK